MINGHHLKVVVELGVVGVRAGAGHVEDLVRCHYMPELTGSVLLAEDCPALLQGDERCSRAPLVVDADRAWQGVRSGPWRSSLECWLVETIVGFGEGAAAIMANRRCQRHTDLGHG